MGCLLITGWSLLRGRRANIMCIRHRKAKIVLEQLDKTWQELEFAVHTAISGRGPEQQTESKKDE